MVMDISGTRPMVTAPLPDLNGFMQSWNEASAQAGDASTALARESLAMGMQWLEEGAATTEQWLVAVSGSAHRLAEAAKEAGSKAALATDAGALWGTELELAGNAAQVTGASLQDLWATMVEQQSRFANSALLRHNEVLQRLYQTFANPGTAIVSAAPDSSAGFAPWFDWMNQAMRAAFDTAAGATAATQQAVASGVTEVAGSARASRRGRGSGRVHTR
jgi:hypothetical protein